MPTTDYAVIRLRVSSLLLVVLTSTFALSGCAMVRDIIAPSGQGSHYDSINGNHQSAEQLRHQQAVLATRSALEQGIARGAKASQEQAKAQAHAKRQAAKKKRARKRKEKKQSDVVRVVKSGAKVKKRHRSKVLDRFDTRASDDALLFVGTFLEKSDSEQLLVVDSEGLIALYERGRRIAQLRASFPTTEDAPSRDFKRRVQVVNAVRDGTLQVLVYHQVENNKGQLDYRVSMLKVIGREFAPVFQRTLFRQTAPSEEVLTSGKVEFIRDKRHRAIRWIPFDENGHPRLNQIKELEWNHWEGVFRVPKTPPTAKKRRS